MRIPVQFLTPLASVDSIFEDFKEGILDSIQQFFHDLILGIVTACMQCINQLVVYTVDQTKDGLVSSFLTTSPENFSYGSMPPASSQYSIWNRIKGICDTAVVPIAGSIMTIVLLQDLIQMLLRSNYKEFDESVLFKWIVKCACGLTLINHSYDLATGLFALGTSVVSSGASFIGVSGGSFNADLFASKLDSLSIGELAIIMIPAILTLVAVLIMIVAIVVVLVQRIIESFMYLGVAPLPVATLMGETWSGVGKNWIKSIVSIAFQGLFIIICIGFFSEIYKGSINTLLSLSFDKSPGDEGFNLEVMKKATFSMMMLLGFASALIFTILRSSQISKSIFNAG